MLLHRYIRRYVRFVYVAELSFPAQHYPASGVLQKASKACRTILPIAFGACEAPHHVHCGLDVEI